MRIVHISDTHGKHYGLAPLPPADIIVHSGDFTFAGSEGEAEGFLQWFCGLPYKHKVLIAGNHDACMYGKKHVDGLPDNIYYLYNSGVEIEGVKFFGIPLFMEDVRDGSLDKMVSHIPEDTQVLVTHQPPFGYGDLWKGQHCGSRKLRQKVDTLYSLRLHLFGHQHGDNNQIQIGKVIFSNAAILDSQYHMVADPRVITY